MTNKTIEGSTVTTIPYPISHANPQRKRRLRKYVDGGTVADFLGNGGSASSVWEDWLAGYVDLSPQPETDLLDDLLIEVFGVSRPLRRYHIPLVSRNRIVRAHPDSQERLSIYGRHGTLDFNEVSEVRAYDKLLEFDGKQAVDVGGHVGCFALLAKLRGGEVVAAVEPNDESAIIYEMNTGVTPIRAAMMTDAADMVPFRKVIKGTPARSSAVLKLFGATTVMVPSVHPRMVYGQARPDIIKADCEGAEYDILINAEMPSSVTQVVVEFTRGRPVLFGDRLVQASELYSAVDDVFDSWECVKHPGWPSDDDVNQYNEVSLGGWRR